MRIFALVIGPESSGRAVAEAAEVADTPPFSRVPPAPPQPVTPSITATIPAAAHPTLLISIPFNAQGPCTPVTREGSVPRGK